MKKTYLKEYARLLVKCGIAVKKGDIVIVNAGLDQPEFVKMVVEECYRAKAARVHVEWSYLPLTKVNVNNMSAKLLGKVEAFEEEKLKYRLEKNVAMLHIVSDDPDGLKGINQKKYAASMAEKMKVIKPYRDAMDNKYKWCIAAVPGKEWAKKVFPGERTSVAIEKLSELEQRLIVLRYFRDLSQTETAKILGLTQVKVSREEKKIMAKLRAHML